MLSTEIIEYFRFLDELLSTTVKQVEVKPIRIKTDMYITGFKRININQVEAHVKRIKTINLKIDEHVYQPMLKDTAEEEMWIDVELMSAETIRSAFNDLRNYFFTLKGFEIANLKYRLKSEPDNLCSHEETIIYDDKKMACRETIAKRKLCTMFQSKFTHWGTGSGTRQAVHQYSMSDEDFADMALE